MVLSLFVSVMIAPGLASTREIRVRVNDEYITFDVKPVIENGRTLVPFRAIFEKLGAEVEWDGATNGVTAIKDDVTIKLTLNNRVGHVNGKPYTLDVAPKVISGRTMVPLRFIVESMGLDIQWVEEAYEIVITLPEVEVPITAITRVNQPTKNETGGAGLQLAYASGTVEFTADYMSLPEVATPGNLNTGVYFANKAANTKWLGLTIPTPTYEVASSGSVSITVKESYRSDVVYEDIKYSSESPVQYYISALAPGRSVSLELVWNNKHSETLSIVYTDTNTRKVDNLFVHTAASEFKGTHVGTRMVELGDGAFALESINGQYPTQGVYTSETLYTQPFEYLVMSWNADTPKNTYVEIEARVMRSDGIWSTWMSWGKWGRYIDSARANTSDTYVRMDTDVLIVRGSQREEAVALQYRVKLNSEDPSATPTVRLVAGTMRNTLAGRTIPKAYDKAAVDPKLTVDLPVPQYSQYIRDPQYASVICSPTSLAMVMEYHGVEHVVEAVARATWDNAFRGYGNWSFNAAVAGSEGLLSYIDYFGATDDETLDLVRLELAKGNPIIASVRYVNSLSVAASWPLLEGAPIASTSGHIVVIRGIMEKEGVTYLICNDSASPSDETVRREYRADQLLKAWHQRVGYIVRPSHGDGGSAAPQISSASFEATGKTGQHLGVDQAEYQLKDSAGNIISLSNKNGTRILSVVYRKDGEPDRFVVPTNEDTIWLNVDHIAGYEYTVVLPAGEIYRVTMK